MTALIFACVQAVRRDFPCGKILPRSEFPSANVQIQGQRGKGMSENLKTAKFGGSSLAEAGQFRKVIDIIKADPSRRFIVASAHTFKRNFYIYKNSRATMICILQTVCPTAIFNFTFSTFNFKKLPFGHNMLFDIYKLSARIGNGGSPCGRPMCAV